MHQSENPRGVMGVVMGWLLERGWVEGRDFTCLA